LMDAQFAVDPRAGPGRVAFLHLDRTAALGGGSV
jgi:hypothetical protein